VVVASSPAWALARTALPEMGSVGAPRASEPLVAPSGSKSSAKTVSGYLYCRQVSSSGLNCGGAWAPKVPQASDGPRMSPLPGKSSDDLACRVLVA
jgi:hypothetical protein